MKKIKNILCFIVIIGLLAILIRTAGPEYYEYYSSIKGGSSNNPKVP